MLARMRVGAGACLRRTAVLSAIHTGFAATNVLQGVTDRSSQVLARFASSSVTAASCESSALKPPTDRLETYLLFLDHVL